MPDVRGHGHPGSPFVFLFACLVFASFYFPSFCVFESKVPDADSTGHIQYRLYLLTLLTWIQVFKNPF